MTPNELGLALLSVLFMGYSAYSMWQRSKLEEHAVALQATLDGIIKLKELKVAPGAADFKLEVPFELQVELARHMAAMLVGCPNYRELTFNLPESAENAFRRITIHVLKHDGKTPHELRIEAEKQRDRAVASCRWALELFNNNGRWIPGCHADNFETMMKEALK